MIRNRRDFYAGLLFMAFGVAALIVSQSYPVGTAARMGPGYFPRLLGILLLALGGLQSAIGVRGSQPGEPLDWHWRPLFILLVSVGLFIFVAPWLGMIAAGLVLVFVSSAASAEFRTREALISGVVQGLAAAALFAYGLGVPLPIWPVFLTGG